MEADKPADQARSLTAPPRFLFVDGLRGVAALWVVLFHLHEGQQIPSLTNVLPEAVMTPLFRWGNAGVPIFFALSGFVIAHSLRGSQFSAVDGLRFLVRRSLRLDPPYYASIAFVLLMAFASSRATGEFFEPPTGGQLLAHLFYVQGLLGYEQISDVYWTLCYEMQFYMVSCPLFIWTAGRPRREFVFLLAALVSLPWGLGIVRANLHPGLFIDLWYAFLAGLLCYRASTGRMHASWFYSFTLAVLCAGVIHGDRFAIVSTSTALALYAAMRLGRMSNWLSGRGIQWLGAISYSLYLTHNQVTGATAFVLRRVFGSGLWAELIALPIMLGACLVVAYVMWRLIERPCMKLSRRFSGSGRSPAPTAFPQVTGG